MTTVYSADEQNDALDAADAAADGVKRAAFLGSWQDAVGEDPRIALYLDDTLVWHATHDGELTITGTAFVIEDAAQVAISEAALAAGDWEVRVENAADDGVYFGAPVTASPGSGFTLSGSLSIDGLVTIGTLIFNAPPLDTIIDPGTYEPEQIGALVTGSNVGSLTFTLSTQPSAGNKVLVPFAFYEGFRALDDPTDLAVTLWLDPTDFSTLKQNTDGTGSVSAAGQLVRRINNKGSAGGYFSSSTGWYLRRATNGAYYLEMTGSTQFVSNLASSSFIGASAAEVIVACRPSNSANYADDHWYQPAIWEAGDGRAGVSFKSSTVAEAFNREDSVSLTQVQDTDQIITWRHTGSVLSGAVGFSSDPANTTASGDTTSITTGFALGGVYHGGFPRLSGRFYGIVAKTAALSTTHRDFAQWYLHRRMIPVTALANPTVTDNAANAYEIVASHSDSARLLTGLAVCHNVAAGSGTFTVTVTMPGSKGYFAAAQALECAGLIGAAAVDVIGGASTNSTSGGSLAVTTATTTQAQDLAVSVHGLYNDDSDANMAAPSGYTVIGSTDDAAALVAMVSAYKTLAAIGAQSATATWDADSNGGAAAVLVTFKAGENTDPPSGGGGDPGEPAGDGELTVNLLASDVNTSLAHEYLMDGVNPAWSWGTYPRAGVGANPPQATGWTAPAWVPWGHAGTERGNPPGTHNWRLALFNIYHAEKRNGVWAWTGTQVTSTSQHSGAMYLDYETNDSTPADRRTSNGYVEVKFPTSGGAYHWYPTFRTSIPATGAQHRAVLMQAALTKDDPGGTDDRASAKVAMLVGGDYWRSQTTQWGDGYSNDDFWIGRARRPAIYPETSWHSAHTMTSEADILEFIAFVEASGILD